MKEIKTKLILISFLILLATLNWFIPGIFSFILLFFAFITIFADVSVNNDDF